MGKKNIGGAVLDDLKALPKKILKPYYKNGKLNANKIAIDGIPFVIIFYVINKYVQAVVSVDGGDMLDKCVKAFSLIFQVKPYFAPSFKLTPLICGIGAGVAFKLFMNSRKKNAKQFRPREEYGSAKWGTDKDFEPYTDPVKWNNIPLTATEWLRMTRPEHPKYDRNKNILIVGGSGAGKTRGFVKPSLMQMQCSYVVTDPKGTVLEEVGTMLARGAYAFCVPAKSGCRRVAVYEACVDVLAHMTLEQRQGSRDKYRLELGGISAPKEGQSQRSMKKPQALEHFLSQHPEITEIEVCTDNDFAGRWACEHIRKAYEGSYRIIENLPEIEGADWADMAKMAARTPEKRQNREAR